MVKVSIITVCLNNKDTLEDTIKSVISQTYPFIEYIVVDGVSSDGTLDIIHKYKDKIDVFISEKDEGIYFAINKGLSKATGDIIGILHADDCYADAQVISNVVKAFEDSGADGIYGNLQYVDRINPGKIVRNWVAGPYKPGMFRKGWMPPHPAFFVKRECVEKYGNYTTLLRTAADYEFMLRLIHKHHIKIAYLPKTLVQMKIGGESNKSVSNRLKANLEDRRAWKMNNLKPSSFTLFIKPMGKIGQFLKR